MIRTLEVRGAPLDRGVVQGRAHRHQVVDFVERQVRPLGWLGALETRHAVHRGPGLALKRFLVQEHERLRGIALGAGLADSLVELVEMNVRVSGVGSVRGSELEARFDLPDTLAPLLLLRRSVPDAVGFESVELGAVPFTGCLAGVNRYGLGVLVLEDRSTDEVSLRALAQDFLLRASELSSGCRHLELRARHAGGTGELLIADALGRALRIELSQGALAVRDEAPRTWDVAEATVRLDLVGRSVRVRALDGSEESLGIEAAD